MFFSVPKNEERTSRVKRLQQWFSIEERRTKEAENTKRKERPRARLKNEELEGEEGEKPGTKS
jgi:hypothetical protein